MSSGLKNKLREIRVASNSMTQQQLATLVGVSRQTIISIESGRYSPSLELAIKISEALDYDLQQLFWLAKD
ncbi:MAG: helix-turn-helix transcriptional regulator [Aquiluna sp.]|jgi:putative transcriptional regulator|nr:helix-turn-helix transcriptional regulator [Aquiluna sp.]